MGKVEKAKEIAAKAFKTAQQKSTAARVAHEELLDAAPKKPSEKEKAAAKAKLDAAKKARDDAKAAAALKKAQATEEAKKNTVTKTTKTLEDAITKVTGQGLDGKKHSGAATNGASLLGALLVAMLVMS